MTGYRNNGAHDASTKSRAEHIKDVLNAGKAQTHKGSVNDAIHVFVEVLVPPKKEEQDGKLANFFGKSCFDESRIENRFGIPDEIDDFDEDKDHEYANDTTSKSECKHSQRLFFVFVLPVNVNQ